MPTKKETKKKKVIKKKVTKQKQKQSQVQKVVVNIHKPTGKSSKPKTSSKASSSTSSSSSTSQPKFQAENSPYPSYVRQAPVVAVTQPVAQAVGNTIRAEPADRTYVDAKKRRAELSLIGKSVNIFNSDNESENLFKPIKQEPNIEYTTTYEEPIAEAFSGENPMKEKRQYIRKKEGPRRNSTDDLLNRYQAATGYPFDGPNVKVKTLKEIVEGLERFPTQPNEEP